MSETYVLWAADVSDKLSVLESWGRCRIVFWLLDELYWLLDELYKY